MLNQRASQISREYMSRCEHSYQHFVDTNQKCETRTTNGDRFTQDSDSMRVIEILLNSEIARKGPKSAKGWSFSPSYKERDYK